MAVPFIAVVDHDSTFLKLMEGLLSTEGYQVLTINDGSTVYEILKREPPDLVIVDTWLGQRDQGVDLIQVLKLDPVTAEIPILVVSSDDRETVAARLGREEPGFGLLFKPFNPDDLLNAARQLIGRRDEATAG